MAVVAIAVIAVATSLMRGSVSPQDSGPKLTHTITRGDLVVSVTEEGTLESSSNKEIKCKVKGGSTVLWVIEAGTEVKPGDELVRLDTSAIEDSINQQKIAYQTALATFAQSESDVAVAKINITEYLEGTYRSELKVAQSNVTIAKENLRTAQNSLAYAERMFRKGYQSKLQLEAHEFALENANLDLEVQETNLDVLQRFTKPKMLQDLRGILNAKEAKLASDKAGLDLEKARLARQEEQLANCIIHADASGMVIHPSAARWREQPDIEEGASVREDQVLLIIPDLNQMQVKVGIHESKIDQVKPGLPARVNLQDAALDAEVLSVATVTRPAGWWTGNVVKYDTIIKLNDPKGLKPGMSAEVEVFLARHEDVLTIPVAAVLEQEGEFFCWVKTPEQSHRRSLELGDSNDQFIVVEAGLKEGDQVVLNPLAFVEDAQAEALKPVGESAGRDAKSDASKSPEPASAKSKSAKPNSAETATAKTATKNPTK